MDIPSLFGQAESLGLRRVFAEPIERDGTVMVLAASLRGGGGGGEGMTAGGPNGSTGLGGGFGVVARPAGAFVLRHGRVQWRPAIDLNRIIMGGQIVAAAALLTLRVFLRARRTGANARRPGLFGRFRLAA